MNNQILDTFINECENNMIITNESYIELLKFLNSNYNQPDIVMESFSGEDTDTKYPVYIVLMHSGTMLANLIKHVTHDTYSHCCISFTDKLDPMYSFGRKKLDMAETGFWIGSPKDEFFKKFKAKYSVYVLYVNKEAYENMKSRMNYFIENESTLKYNISGLLFNYVHLPSENQKKYFCSGFVADILSAGKLTDKKSSLYRPNEFSSLKDIQKIDEGDDFSEYDYKHREVK